MHAARKESIHLSDDGSRPCKCVLRISSDTLRQDSDIASNFPSMRPSPTSMKRRLQSCNMYWPPDFSTYFCIFMPQVFLVAFLFIRDSPMAAADELWTDGSRIATWLNALDLKFRLWGFSTMSRKQYSRLDRDEEEEEEEGKLALNPFADPMVAELWKLKYENAQYECRHIFDPDVSWTREEERRVVHRLDLRICLWAVDRGNLAQAVSDDMLQDLSLDTNDYNKGNTIFLITFVCAELPSQLVSKKIGPDRWIPSIIVLWSLVGMSQASLSGKSGFFATRAFMGLLEGGFVPDIILWLSYFYTGDELPVRLSYFWMTISLTGILTSFLGVGLLHMRGILGWAGWRWLFLFEGALTMIIGLASFFMMPASAVETKTRLRPNGWFTEQELSIVVNRILRDDPSKGEMHNRQGITLGALWEAAMDYDLWPLYAVGLISFIPPSPVGTYLTLTLRSLGFNSIETSLLAIPSGILHIIMLLVVTRLSERYNERTLFSMLQNIWILPCLLALRFWPGVVSDAWGTFWLITTLLGYPYSQAIIVGWISRNSNAVSTRGVSVALYNILMQVGNIYANSIYKEQDKPLYRHGNLILIAINFIAIALFAFLKVYYLLRNRYRDSLWRQMTPLEQQNYSRYTEDKGSKRLDFRFAH